MGRLTSNPSDILREVPSRGSRKRAVRIGLEERPMPFRTPVLRLCLALPLTGSAQDRKPPAKKPASPTDLETDHWLVNMSIPALPNKDFDQMLEAYYKL